jgi:serine/threonine protein kinase/tetratricopeptide (TPR) repeat protein
MINVRYKILKKLGEGRSKVFLCNDIDSPQSNQIAIKILPKNAAADEIKKFKDEYFTIQKLLHPNIVRSYDYGEIVKKDEDDKEIELGSKFLTIEYFKGKELTACDDIKDEAILKEIIKQICAVLYYLHQSNYIYYDLKPENILVNIADKKPTAKLIDFGFIQYINADNDQPVRGSAQYIAPEILKNEEHDHRADLYSLGIILYKIIYGKFPFDSQKELDIYKAQIEKEFEFPETNYSEKLVKVTKKLLEKDPVKRYKLSLEVINDLGLDIDEKTTVNFRPARVFTNRKDILNILRNYITDERSTEIFSIRGFENSGKTSIINEVNSIYEESVLINNEGAKPSVEFLNFLLKQITYNENVHSKLTPEIVQQIEQVLNKSASEISDSIKQIFAGIATNTKFVLLMDDFNVYNTFILDIFKEIIPILQVNKIKIIITENSDIDHASDIFSNVRTIDLTPFTEKQLSEMLVKSYVSFFPVPELKKLILLYADLYPGNIVSFVDDIILLKILQFHPEGPTVKLTKDLKKIISSSHDEIYKYRLKKIDEKELLTARIISFFNIKIEQEILPAIIKKDLEEVSNILDSLRGKSILLPRHLSEGIEFSSDGIKQFIYNNSPEKKETHLHLARSIRREIPSFDRMELARLFENGEDYYSSYEVLHDEEKEAEKISAFSYQKTILLKELSLPLPENLVDELKFNLAKLHYLLNEYRPALDILNELLVNNQCKSWLSEMLAMKGSCLIELGEQEEGKKILNELLASEDKSIRKQKILVDIAYAEFDLNNYKKAREICENVLSDDNANNEERGRCFNLLGLIAVNETNDYSDALINFEKSLNEYDEAKLLLKEAKIQVNIGNIWYILKDADKAEFYWNKALEMNRTLGNLDQEGNVLISYGYYHFEQMKIEKALEQNQRAYDVFLSLGVKNSQGLALINLAEIFLSFCDYQNSIDSINAAIGIFRVINNFEKEAQAYFVLGKILFALGNYEKLNEVINNYEKLLNSRPISAKHKSNIQFLDCSLKLKIGSIEDLERTLLVLCDIYSKWGEINNYIKTIFSLFSYYDSNQDYEKVLKMINSEELMQICKRGPVYEAERLYWLGLISPKINNNEVNDGINFLNKSLGILGNQIINELTWKVTYEISEYYNKRGNINKSRSFRLYSTEIINHIASKISDPHLQKIYLDEPARKKALEGIVLKV